MKREDINNLLDKVKSTNYIKPELYETYNVKRGLRNSDGTGVLVGLTAIGEVHGYIVYENEKVDDYGVLSYRGIDVTDICKKCEAENRFGFEEVAYLILFGELPNQEQLEFFNEFLGSYAKLPDNFSQDMILKCPSPDIMNKLATCVLALYPHDEKPDDLSISSLLRQSIGLIARIPTIIAQAYHAKAHHYNGKELITIESDPNISIAENFLNMLRPHRGYTQQEAKILDLCMILHAEHGGGNNSAFTTHVVSSTGTDLFSSISAAIGSLKGPKHGGANNRVMAMMDEIKVNVKNWDDEEEVKSYIKKILNKEAFDKSGLVYGMGHAVYTLSDPRAVLLKEQAEKLAKEKGVMKEFSLYDTIERVTPDLFKAAKGTDKSICANLDFYSGFVYNMLDIPPELYTPLFAASRIVGWCAHVIEEVTIGRKIIRPAYKSVAKRREYICLHDRA